MSPRAKTLLILLACTVLGTSCQESNGSESPDKSELALQSVLDEILAKDETIPGAALHVEAPSVGLSWSGAAGMADRALGIEMTPQHPVRIASNTKTFMAAAILRLWEEGRLDLDDPIAGHLPNDFVRMLEADGYHLDAITIRHLLTHTSGLFDYASSEAFDARIGANVRHRWTRAEQLEGAMDWGDPYGKPGEVYGYSDTGYILLGEILERVTELPMGTALRELIGYEELGLTSTWLEKKEPRPPGVPDRAHQFDGCIGATPTRRRRCNYYRIGAFERHHGLIDRGCSGIGRWRNRGDDTDRFTILDHSVTEIVFDYTDGAYPHQVAQGTESLALILDHLVIGVTDTGVGNRLVGESLRVFRLVHRPCNRGNDFVDARLVGAGILPHRAARALDE